MRRPTSISFALLLGAFAVTATACKISLVSTDGEVDTTPAGTAGTTAAGAAGAGAAGAAGAGAAGEAGAAGVGGAGAAGTAGLGGSGGSAPTPTAAVRFANMALPTGGVHVDICIRACADSSCSTGNFDAIQPLFRQIYDMNSAAYQAQNPPVTPPPFEEKFYAPGVSEWIELDGNETYGIRLIPADAVDCKTPMKNWSDQVKSLGEEFYTVTFIGDEAQQLGITVTTEAHASNTAATVRGYNNLANVPAVDVGLIGASYAKAVGPLTTFAPGAAAQVPYQTGTPAIALPGTSAPILTAGAPVTLAQTTDPNNPKIDDISVFGYGYAVGDKKSPAMIIVCQEDDEFEFFGVLEKGCGFY